MRRAIGPITLIIQLGTTVVVATLLPLALGLVLDDRLGTTPWITLVALVVGVIAAVAGVYRLISTQYRNLG